MELLKNYSYYIKDYYGDNLILNLAIAISRMKKGFVLNESVFQIYHGIWMKLALKWYMNSKRF